MSCVIPCSGLLVGMGQNLCDSLFYHVGGGMHKGLREAFLAGQHVLWDSLSLVVGGHGPELVSFLVLCCSKVDQYEKGGPDVSRWGHGPELV